MNWPQRLWDKALFWVGFCLVLTSASIQAMAVVVLPEYKAGANASVAMRNPSVFISVPARRLYLLDSAQRVLRDYPVAVGKPGFPTPAGRFSIITLVKQPGFENPYKPQGASQIAPGSNNPLGTRWMGFKKVAHGEYGLHGTNQPDSIGKFASHGCVRMYIKDAEDLFDRVTFGTPVTVNYDATIAQIKGNQVILTTSPDVFGLSPASTGAQVSQALKGFFPNAQLLQPKLVQSLTDKNGSAVVIGELPDPNEYNKQVELSVSGVIPGKTIPPVSTKAVPKTTSKKSVAKKK
ncbi:MAG: L,D-transpeptidase [Vampirovibrionales bacterium]|nr:L,D-transpeptidase [Vampirovibrionales bacterium]